MRYKCTVSYDGSLFHGFQVQNNLRTVQSEIEKVLTIINKKKVNICAGSRTDAGVHASGQVFHFDSDYDIPEENMRNAINSRLPADIHIVKTIKAADDFNARYDAVSKEYRYLIDLGEYDPLKRNFRYYCKRKIDTDSMRKACSVFIGVHDFKSFSKGNETENTVREIYDIVWKREGDLITLLFTGNGFLHNMIRIIVAMLLEVGKGKKTKEDLKTIMDAKDRRLAPKTAPPGGLCLLKINY